MGELCATPEIASKWADDKENASAVESMTSREIADRAQ
jgi:hypothetical protein